MARIFDELCTSLHSSGAWGTLSSGWTAGGRSLLNFVYPASCLSCDFSLSDSGQHLCDGCWNQILRTPKARCRRCSCPLETESDDCANCREWTPAFERAVVLAPFNGPMQVAVHALKFQHQLSLGTQIGRRLARVSDFQESFRQLDVLIPVPLHPARLRERGYNQSRLIAEGLGQVLGKPHDTRVLRRRMQTRQQAKLDAQVRRQNLASAFVAERALETVRIGLVDDVLTTGATLDACAAALKLRGCPSVLAIAAASPFLY